MCPAIVIVCCVGIYSVNNSPEDVLPTSAVALFGDAATRLGLDRAIPGGRKCDGPTHREAHRAV